MRSRYSRVFAAAAMVFLLVETGSGQNTTRITLDQAIDLALAHNHSLQATRTQILQNQAQEITANLLPNPTLGVDTQFIPFFSPQDFSGDNLNKFSSSILGSDTSSDAVTSGSGGCRPPQIRRRSRAPRRPTRSKEDVVQLYTPGYLKQAQDSRDISEYAYKRGAASLLDYLGAKRSYRPVQLVYRHALTS